MIIATAPIAEGYPVASTSTTRHLFTISLPNTKASTIRSVR